MSNTNESTKMNIVYQSITGRTNHFVTCLSKMFKNVHLIRITDQTDLFKIHVPFFCFVPTYIHGNHNVYKEVGTLSLHDELSYNKNYKYCLGFVGSGNRNFGVDSYCWTARYYSEIFKRPMIANYELSGDNAAANQIDNKMTQIWNAKSGYHSVSFTPHRHVNPRLAKLEKKYGNLK